MSRGKRTTWVVIAILALAAAGWWFAAKTEAGGSVQRWAKQLARSVLGGQGPGDYPQARDLAIATAQYQGDQTVRQYEEHRTQEPLLEGYMGGVYRLFAKSKRSGGFDDRAWRYYNLVYNSAVLTLAREIASPQDAVIALRPYFRHWTPDYVRMVNYIRSRGYTFKSMADYRPGDEDRKIAYMRHDIHLRDVAGALGFMDANQGLGVRADYFIMWDHSSREQKHREVLRLMSKFRRAGDCFGLHAAPPASWLALERFKGDWAAYLGFVRSEEFVGYMADPANRERLKAGSMQRIEGLCREFRDEFGDFKIAAAHGSAFDSRMFKLLRQGKLPPEAEALLSENLLTAHAAQNKGVYVESYEFMKAHRLVYITDNHHDNRRFWQTLKRGLATGRAIMILLHPAVIHRGQMSLARPAQDN